MRRKTLTINVLLMLASLSLCLSAPEAYLRIIAPKSPAGTTYGKEIRRNSDGFRDREFRIPKPENTYRILMLGDSFAWGVGLDVEQAIPKVLENSLAGDSQGRRFEVINAAIPGYNTVEELRLLQTRGLKYEPDMVILIYNLNDIEYKPDVSANQAGERLNALPVVPGRAAASAQFDHKQGIRGLIFKAEMHSELVAFITPRIGSLLRRAGIMSSLDYSWVEKQFQGFVDKNQGWVQSANSLRTIARMTGERNIKFLVAIYPTLVELDRYRGKKAHETIRRLCEEIEVQSIDLLDVFENTNGRSYWINYLDAHPNARAHRMVADRLHLALKGLLPLS